MNKFLLVGLANLLYSTTAVAEEAAAGSAQGGVMSTMVMFSAIFVIFYLLMIKPQNKKQKEQRELLGRLGVDDEVVTTGGIVGRIARVTDNFYLLAISNGVEILLQKNAIAAALPKGTIKSA